jgi:uncharacterized protein YciI
MTGFTQEISTKLPISFDDELAKKIGANDIGMKRYVIAFLKSGPVKLTDSTQRAELQKTHMKNIGKMAEDGKLIAAGPFLDNQPLRGIYIFDTTTLEKAQKLTETDPAVKDETLIMELHPWYGSAAMMEVPRIRKMLEKKNSAE